MSKDYLDKWSERQIQNTKIIEKQQAKTKKMGSFNELKKQLTASDVETIMTDMGYDWENDYHDYEEFINAIDEYLNQNKEDE